MREYFECLDQCFCQVSKQIVYQTYFKRLLDFVAALSLLLLFSPIILSTYALLLVANRGGALFFQVRPGHQSDLFVIIKFKTMRDGADAEGNLLPDEVRLTSIGKVVRALSIDELLQLINVLKGDMSLVGPRPLLTQYLSRYTAEQARSVIMLDQGLQAGHRSMGGIPLVGKRNLG